MKKKVLHAVLAGMFLLIFPRGHSQEITSSREYLLLHRNYIGLALSQLPFADFRLSYERRLVPSHSVVISAGYKLAFRGFTDATQIDLGQKPTGWCYRNTATWLYLAAGYKYYFTKKKLVYVSPEVFYKNMWADKVTYTFGVDPGGSTLTNQYEVRTMKTDLVGMNLLIGKKCRFRISDTFNMGFDFYTGLTVRYKLIGTTIYGTRIASRGHDESVHVVSIPLSEDPEIINDKLFQVSGQFGVILYCSWL